MRTSFLRLILIASLATSSLRANDVDFFEAKIRPVLVAECYGCHSATAASAGKLKGGLLLDTREATRRGGESGPAVVPGDVSASLLLSALKHESFQMPPTKRLPKEVVADFERWIRSGATDPRDGKSVATTTVVDFAKARREHWAFQPLSKPVSPAIPVSIPPATAIRNDVDRLLVRAGPAAPECSPHLLLRRVCFDLIGLPPSIDDIEAFVHGKESYEAIVDRLLASPHYGERWGRHWLDLARYADSSGFHNDLDRPQAWRYRDWVIDAFNQDKPFARFVAEQLAGDEVDNADEQSLIATGFNCAGPSNADNMGKTARDLEQYRLDQLDDTISTTAVVFLGLTVGCSRCHDHKIDPITSEDYYRLLAIFNGAQLHGGPVRAPKKEDEDKQPKLLTFVESSAVVKPTYLLRRGNVDQRGPEVQPGVPAIAALEPVSFPKPEPGAKTSGRRRAFAAWIASPNNPLSYRVLANRLWQHHFGRGIVATPSNFGLGGARPTQPELLDFLAQHIIADGGRLKSTQRLIVTSAAYRQAAGVERPLRRLEAESLRDAILALSGKLNPARGGPGIKPRIRAELLDTSQRNKWPTVVREGPEHWRRSVYIYVKRQLLMPMMELFDAPTTTSSVSERSQSVVPTQALLMMNDEFIEEQAGFLADRLLAESKGDLPRATERLLLATLCKPPSSDRLRDASEFVSQRVSEYRDEPENGAKRRALADLAHVLFSSHEFAFVE